MLQAIHSIQTLMHAQVTTCTVQVLVGVFGNRSRPGLIDHALALINGKVRRSYMCMLPPLIWGCYHEWLNEKPPVKRPSVTLVLRPHSSPLPVVHIANPTQHTWDHFRYVFCAQLPLLNYATVLYYSLL